MVGMDEFRKAALQRLAWQIARVRQQGDEFALQLVIGWGEARVPQFRKIDSVPPDLCMAGGVRPAGTENQPFGDPVIIG